MECGPKEPRKNNSSLFYELVHLFIVPEIESAHPVDTEVQS